MEGGFLSPLIQLAVSLNFQRRSLASLPFPYHPIHGGNTAAVTWKLMDTVDVTDLTISISLLCHRSSV